MISTRSAAYEITAKLGEGGLGVVYRATDSSFDRHVAIKVLPPPFTADRKRRSAPIRVILGWRAAERPRSP